MPLPNFRRGVNWTFYFRLLHTICY